MDDLCYACDGTGERDFLSGASCLECNGTGWRDMPEPEYEAWVWDELMQEEQRESSGNPG